MLLATEPGSSKASTGAHALGPLTLPVIECDMLDRYHALVCCPAMTRQRAGTGNVTERAICGLCVCVWSSQARVLDLCMLHINQSHGPAPA